MAQRSEQVSRRLKLRQLNVLVAVAQWGSMAKAAEHLSISQPVVSKAIAELEQVSWAFVCSIAIASRDRTDALMAGRCSSEAPLFSTISGLV